MHVSRNILLSFIFILRFAKSKQAESDTYLCFNEIYELENVIAASDENVRKVLTKLKEQFEIEQNEKRAESAESKIQQNKFQDAEEYENISYEWYKRSSQEILYRAENIRHLHKGVDIARASFLEFYKQFTPSSNGNPSEFYALMKSDWVSIVVLERGSSFTKFVREERDKIFDAFKLIQNRLETQNIAHFLTSFTNKCALIFKSIDSYILTKDSVDLTKKQNKKQVYKMEKSEEYAFIDTFVNLNSLLSGAIMKLREIDEFLISQKEISRFEIAAFNLVLICEYISSIKLYKQEVQASENLKRRIYRELHVLEFVREEIEETIETVKVSSKTPPKNAEDNNLQVEQTLEHVITSSLDGILELKKYTAENLKDTDFEDSYNEFIKQYSANITTVMYKPKTWDAKTQVTFTLFETYYKLALEAHARKAEQTYLNTERSQMIVQLRIAIFELKNALLVTEEFGIDKFNAEVCQTINLLTPRLEETFLAVYALTEAMSKEESEYKKFSASALETLDKEVRNLIMAEKNLKSHQLSENSKVISKKFTDYFNTLEFDNNIKSIRTRIDDISKIRDVRYATRERFKIDSQSFNIEMLDATQKNDYNFLEDKQIEVGISLESRNSKKFNLDLYEPNKVKCSALEEDMFNLLKNIKKVYSEQITKVEIDACYSECEKIVKEKTALFTSHQLVRIATINVEMLGLLTEKMVCENYEIQLIGDIKASKTMSPETTQNKPWFLTRAITTTVNYTRLNKFWQKQLSGDDIKITDTFKQDMKALYETDTNGNAVGERNDAKEIVDNLVLVANVFLHYIPIPKKIENNGSQENQPTETHISWLHRLMSHCTNQKATFLAAQEGNQSNALRAEAERKSTEEVRLKRAEATIKKLSDEQKFREFAELKKRAETAQKTTNEALKKVKEAKELVDQKVSKMDGLQKSKEDTEKILNDLQEQYNNKFQEFDAIKSKHNAWLREARSHESETADKEFLIEYHAKCETAPKILEDLQTKISGVQEKSNKEHLALQKATDDVKTANKNLEYQVSLANACKTYSDKLANKEKVARASLPSANE